MLVNPLETELGWSRATISFAVSIGLLLYGLYGPVSGWLMDRFGPERLTLAGLAIIGTSTLAGATVTELWQLTLFWGVLSGIGTGVVGPVLGATVANRWFVERRGLVLGIFGAAHASYLGGVLRDSFGDYTAAFLGAGILAVIAAMMALLVRRRPAFANPEARS